MIPDTKALVERLRAESRKLFPPYQRDGHGYHSTAFILDKAADALEALSRPDDGWRPIETAPKDGTPILCFNRMVGIYNTGFTTSWDDDGDGYEGFPCGFWGSPHGKWDCQPTHWRQLPPTPEQGSVA